MKKNLKACIEQVADSERQCLVDMNSYELIEASGMTPDLRHRRSAHMTGAWRFADAPTVTVPLGGANLSEYRYVSFGVFAVGGAGGEFTLRFDSDVKNGGGYETTLAIEKDGWNDYRVYLPLLRSVKNPTGWQNVDSITLDSVAGGVANRPETVLYVDSMFVWEFLSPQYCRMPELKGAAAFAKSGSYAIVDRKRIAIAPDGASVKPFETREDGLWLPMAPIATVLGHTAVADTKAGTLSFTYRRKKYAFADGVRSVTVNGAPEALDFAPMLRDGCLFFPAEYVKSFFRWRQLFTDPTGLIILSNRRAVLDGDLQAGTIRTLVADMTYVRPDSRAVLEDIKKNVPNPNRSRLLVSQERLLQLRREAKTDENLKEYVRVLKETYGTGSAAFRSLPTCASVERAPREKEEELALVAKHLLAFAMLYRVTGDKAYCERAAAECEALAEYTDWSTNTFVGAATVAFAVAVAYDWCHHVWSEARKAVVERALLRNALRPALECYEGRGRLPHPASARAAEMHKGILAAALALSDIYPETVNRLLGGILPALEDTMAAFSPDGGYEEGVGAWGTAAESAALSVAMLLAACGKDYGFASAPGLTATAYFSLRTSGRKAMWNFHNSAEVPADTSILSWFAWYFKDTRAAWMRRRQLLDGVCSVHPWDILYYQPVDDTTAPTLPLDAVYRRAGIAVVRSDWSDAATVFGLHAGSNHALDADLDAGDFFLEMGGERFFCETGGVEAMPMLLRRRAEGQNTLTVNPAPAPAPDQNPDAVARFTEMRSSKDRVYVVADLTSTNDALLAAKRGILLDEGRTLAVVQDELRVLTPSTVVWNAYTDAEVAASPAGRSLKLKKNGKTVLCRLCGVGSPARFVAEPVEGTSMTHLTVRVEVKERVRMAVACRLIAEDASFGERLYEIAPISTWSKSKE